MATVKISGARFVSNRAVPDGTKIQFFVADDGTVVVYGRIADRTAVAIVVMEGDIAVIPDAPFFGTSIIVQDPNPAQGPGSDVQVSYEYVTDKKDRSR